MYQDLASPLVLSPACTNALGVATPSYDIFNFSMFGDKTKVKTHVKVTRSARHLFDLPGSSNLGGDDTTITIETKPKMPPVVAAQPTGRPCVVAFDDDSNAITDGKRRSQDGKRCNGRWKKKVCYHSLHNSQDPSPHGRILTTLFTSPILSTGKTVKHCNDILMFQQHKENHYLEA
ncbi:hypothetical protein Tco_1019709 [Tanacetum coccineum]|uniref:Uncharacterized protein n=1 Tax=Tanacetum coccineum TaxID=301880 RepID=A0ABQ5FY38_9ASTR